MMGSTVAERSIAGLYDLSNPTTLYYVALVTVFALYLSWRAVLSPFGFGAARPRRTQDATLGHPVFRYQLTVMSPP